MNKFAQELSKIPIDQRCIQSNTGKLKSYDIDTCFIGVPSDDLYGRIPLEHLPERLEEIYFLLPNLQDLVAAFAGSEHCQTVKSISIGGSSYYREFPVDYTSSIAPLKDANCPNLKILDLGASEQFANENEAYGKVGAITAVLQNLSHVEELYLGGNFEVTEPIEFKNVTDLDIILGDSMSGINGGPISNTTLSNMLCSSFPKLRNLYVVLDDCRGAVYTLPDKFLTGENCPALSTLEIVGEFSEKEREQLMQSPLNKKLGKDRFDTMCKRREYTMKN